MATVDRANGAETYKELLEFQKPDNQKTKEELLRERDEWKHAFNQLIETFPEPIFAVDNERKLRYFNSEAENAYGRSKDEAIGTEGYKFFGTEGESEILAETVARTEQTVWEKEFRKVPTPEGHLWNRSMAVPIETLDGAVIGAVELTPIVTDIVEARNKMAKAQEQVTENVMENVDTLRANAESVADSSAAGATIAVEQHDKATAVKNEVSDLSASIEEVAATAHQVTKSSDHAQELAVDGQTEAAEAIDRMTSVTNASSQMAEDVDELRAQLDEIDDIVEVIHDIADQTNMLALNASIEAARADEAGAGFAVVADEVKSLAEESQKNATEIEKSVQQIIATATETIESIDETNNQLVDATGRTEQVMENLSAITDAVKQTAQGTKEVSHVTDDQAANAEEIATLIDELAVHANSLADEVKTIKQANQGQVELVTDIEQSVAELAALIADLDL